MLGGLSLSGWRHRAVGIGSRRGRLRLCLAQVRRGVTTAAGGGAVFVGGLVDFVSGEIASAESQADKGHRDQSKYPNPVAPGRVAVRNDTVLSVLIHCGVPSAEV